MRGFLLWTRVACWALLVGLVELVQWLSGSRHGRATAAATLLAALGGGMALLHPAPVSTMRPTAPVSTAVPTPAWAPPCSPQLVPILIGAARPDLGSIHIQHWSEPPIAPEVAPARCPLRVVPIPLADAGPRTSDLVYHTALRVATVSLSRTR